MDRNQRSRRQKSANGSYAQQSRRSMGSRLGLEKGTPRAPKRRLKRPRLLPMRPRGSALRRRSIPRRQATAPARQGARRRVTQAEIITGKAPPPSAWGALGVLAVLAVGAFVSINLLFKVHDLPGREL